MDQDEAPVITVNNVSKTFKLPHEKQSTVKSALINIGRSHKGYETQQVLKGISFEIKKGEFFGIVGRNGSGKSTLLKLLAGIYEPTKGSIAVEGLLTPFIELGVGFNPELTGRENVFLNGALLGFSRKEMQAMYQDIVDFAELERFMDQKLKNYSSGMQVRLAFSIAIRAQGDILLLDEVLAVGDAVFQKKCFDYFKQLKKEKKTVVFVSHDSNALLEYCDKGILLEKGEIICEGNIEKVVNEYVDTLNRQEEANKENLGSADKKRWGTGEARIENTHVLGQDGAAKKVFEDKDSHIVIEVTYKADQPIASPVYGISILDTGGQRIFASNTMWSKVKTNDLEAGQKITVSWTVPNGFNTGSFTVSPAMANSNGSITYDWVDDAAIFKVRKRIHSIAYMNIDHEIKIK